MNWLIFIVIFLLYFFGFGSVSKDGVSLFGRIVATAGLTLVTMVIAYIGFSLVAWLFWPIVILSAIIGLAMIVKGALAK